MPAARAARSSTGQAPSPRPTRCCAPPTPRGARPGSERRPALAGRSRPRVLAGRGLLGLRLELERCRVHAVAEAGRAGPVLEDVAEVCPAVRAVRLDAAHAQGAV